jgi:hypothetical protein
MELGTWDFPVLIPSPGEWDRALILANLAFTRTFALTLITIELSDPCRAGILKAYHTGSLTGTWKNGPSGPRHARFFGLGLAPVCDQQLDPATPPPKVTQNVWVEDSRAAHL